MPAGLVEPMASPCHLSWTSVFPALAVMIVLAGCGGDSTRGSATTAASSTTTIPGATAAPSSTTTIPSDTTEAAADFDVGVDADTEWGEVSNALTTTEQECIRDTFDADLLESVLARPVMSESDTPEAWEVSMFSCLAPQTARAVFLASLVAGMEQDGVFRTYAEAQSCLDEWVAGIDVVATMVALSVEGAEAAGEVTTALMRCNPDLVISLILQETGLTLEDLSEEEASCLHEWATNTDWTTLATGANADPLAVNLLIGLLECAPDLLPWHPSGWRWNHAIEHATPVEIGVVTLDEDRDLFAFEATESGLYELDVSLDDYAIDIYDADGTELAGRGHGSYTAPVIWPAPATGTYYVRVTSIETGAYTLTITTSDIVDDHPNSTANATSVAIGAATQGELEYDGDIDYFAFEATEGEYYDLDVTHETLQLAIIYVYEDEAGFLANGIDFRDSPAPPLTWQAPTTRAYYVGVFSFDRGTYTLTITISDIVDDHPADSTTPVEIGIATHGELEYPADIDYFTFEATGGQEYALDVTLGTLQDSVLELFHADGFRLGANDDYADSTASRLMWHAPATGIYHVQVHSYGRSTGTYTIGISRIIVDDHPDTAANATSVELGAATQGELEHDGDVDYFAFEATQGEYYELDVTLETLPDSRLTIYDTDNSWQASNNDYGDSTAAPLIWRAPATGTYYVQVAGFATLSGTYTLTITIPDIEDDHPNSKENATPVELDITTPGELEYDNDFDFFAFEATRGQAYELDVTLGTLPFSILDLYGADGNWLTSYDDYGDSTSRLVWHAPDTGTYHAEISSWGSVRGTYTLTITTSDITDDHPNSTANATPVQIGTATQGELEHDHDSDFFSFGATEGEYYELGVTLGTLPDSGLSIYDTDGTGSIAGYGESTAAPRIWRAAGTGTYYVRVHSYDTGAGTYTLTITIADIEDDHPNATENATPIETGIATQGELEYGNDGDVFTFEAIEGELYELDVTLGTLQDSVLYLYDADGSVFEDYHSDATTSPLRWEAPATGTYYLLVHSYRRSTGTYTLTVALS